MDPAKGELIRSWLAKAGHDIASARKLAEGDNPILDTAIYHCQQAAEKALKGYLVYRDQSFDKTHDLEVLPGQAYRQALSFHEYILSLLSDLS